VDELNGEQFHQDIDIDDFKEYQLRMALVREVPIVERKADYGDVNAQVEFGKLLQKGDVIRRNKTRAVWYFKRAAHAGNVEAIVEYAKCLYSGDGSEKDVPAAVALWRQAADCGNTEGQYWLAIMHRDGREVPQNDDEAVRLFTAAASSGHAFARKCLVQMLGEGRGVSQNVREALNRFRFASDEDGPVLIHQLAMMYHHGRETAAKNVPKAVGLYSIAAHAGLSESLDVLYHIWRFGESDVPANRSKAAVIAERYAAKGEFIGIITYAHVLELGIGIRADRERATQLIAEAHAQKFASDQFNYAESLESGQRLPLDSETPLAYYLISAKNGNVQAMVRVGIAYENGKYISRDQDEAAQWFRKAADLDDHVAMWKYAFCFLNGHGVKRNSSEALRYLMMAAEKGNPDASMQLGFLYRDGQYVEKDYTKAVECFRCASNKGVPIAMSCLADMYKKGRGVSKDLREAAKLYRHSADLGHVYGMWQFGLCLLTGHGVKRNSSEALRYLMMAAEKGNLDACVEIGIMYREGEHVEKDYTKAVEYFRRASDKQSGRGKAALADMYKNEWGLSKDLDEAARLYRESADLGDVYGMWQFGLCLLNSHGVKRNSSEALRYLMMAAEKGNPDASMQLGFLYRDGTGFERLQTGIQSPRGMSGLADMSQNESGVSEDAGEAARLYPESANSGDDHVMWEYSFLLLNSLRVTRDGTEALRYPMLVAERGNPDACVQGAFTYREGNCVEHDCTKALEYLQREIRKQSGRGMPVLAEMLRDGLRVPNNFGEAARLDRESAGLGDDYPMGQFRLCSLNELRVEMNVSETAKHFKMDSDKRGLDACVDVAAVDRDGNRVEHDHTKPLEYFRLASDKRRSRGKKRLTDLQKATQSSPMGKRCGSKRQGRHA
jgi:TPR repeat protein